jgi:hypothetical protein
MQEACWRWAALEGNWAEAHLCTGSEEKLSRRMELIHLNKDPNLGPAVSLDVDKE